MIMPTMVLMMTTKMMKIMMMVTKKIKLVMMVTKRIKLVMKRTMRIYLQRFPVFAAAPSAAPKPPRVKRILPLS